MYKFGEQAIRNFNKNKIFKFISSVKLAVPLMLALGGIVAWGTVVESMYNSEYAAIVVYKSGWFGLLLIALWINIFAATISRWPFKKHHTGFVITHIGLLMLFAGGYMTNAYGIDGTLVVPESGKSSTVILPKLMVAFQSERDPAPAKISLRREISESGPIKLKSDRMVPFQVVGYKPFVQINSVYQTDADSGSSERAVGFRMKSAFFDTTQWLHSQDSPQVAMGPAQFKLRKVEDVLKVNTDKKSLAPKKANKSAPVKAISKNAKGRSLANNQFVIVNGKSVQNFSFKQLQQGINYNGIKIALSKIYERAVVSGNKIIEGDPGQKSNPAIELMIEKNQEQQREVVYANFEGFSLHTDGVFGLKFKYKSAEIGSSNQIASEESAMSEQIETEMPQPGGNTIEFQYDDTHLNLVRVVLSKNGSLVDQKTIQEGEIFQTPWMGIQITVNSIVPQAVAKSIVQTVQPEKGQDLPGSAIQIEWISNQGNKNNLWIPEGEEKNLMINGQKTQVFYGRETLELPFDISLIKFSKIDYPGTETPMSYESDVQVNNLAQTYKIAMNEPLKMAGFTVYQSSFSITPEQTLSIFSVNQDPGRPLKYLGSLILSLGIIIFTLMRSQFWKKHIEAKGV